VGKDIAEGPYRRDEKGLFYGDTRIPKGVRLRGLSLGGGVLQEFGFSLINEK
jgi:hypothetical protein